MVLERKKVYFGHVDVDECRVKIVDKFSKLDVNIVLDEPLLCVDVLLNECVFLLTSGECIFAFKHQSESVYRLERSLDDDKELWRWTDFVPTEFVKTKRKSFKKTRANVEEEKDDNDIPDFVNRRYDFACSTYGAFFAKNFGAEKSIVMKIYDSRAKKNVPRKWCFDFRIEKICAGNDHIMLLNSSGQVLTWGTGLHGELGHDRLESNECAEVIEFFNDAAIRVEDIAAGSWHSCALTTDGDVYCWGWNKCGQLGLDPDECPSQSVPYPTDVDCRVVSVECEGNSTILRLEDGSRQVYGARRKQLPSQSDG